MRVVGIHPLAGQEGKRATTFPSGGCSSFIRRSTSADTDPRPMWRYFIDGDGLASRSSARQQAAPMVARSAATAIKFSWIAVSAWSLSRLRMEEMMDTERVVQFYFSILETDNRTS